MHNVQEITKTPFYYVWYTLSSMATEHRPTIKRVLIEHEFAMESRFFASNLLISANNEKLILRTLRNKIRESKKVRSIGEFLCSNLKTTAAHRSGLVFVQKR